MKELKLIELTHTWTMDPSASEESEAKRCADDFYAAARELVTIGRVPIDFELVRRVIRKVSTCEKIIIGTPREAFARGATRLNRAGIALAEQVSWYAASYRFRETPIAHPDLVDQARFMSMVWDVYEFGDTAMIIVHPDFTKCDENDEFHCADGPAMSWTGPDGVPGSGGTAYFHHGMFIPKFVANPTKEDLRRQFPAEQRRAIYEWLGHERVIGILGAKLVDEAEIDGSSYKLYSDGTDYAWLSMQSPVLKDGSRPTYTEPVHEGCESCEEALGWRATRRLGVSVRYQHQT